MMSGRLQFRQLLFVVGALLLIPSATAQQLDMDLLQSMQARNIGPAGMSGRVTSIDVVEANPQIMYVGTASGGLWKSESGGIDWKPIFDEQPVASIGALAIYQKNPDIIWAGTGEGNPRNSQTSGAGIFKSLDGGKSWECMGLETTRNIHRVIIHPNNPQVVFVGVQGSAWGTHADRGVYKTTDGGKTWDHILSINDSTGVGDMVMDPHNPDKLIVSMWEFRRWPWFFTSGGEGSGLYVTFDGGDSWTERTSEDGLPEGELGRIGLAISRSNNKVVYALVEAKKNALYRSNDGGFTFSKVGEGDGIGNRPFYYSDIFVDPENENRVYSLFSIVTRSEDGGKTFQQLLGYVGSAGVHPDHHAFWIHPEDPNFLINGNDGGMAISRDKGATWRFVENLPVAQYYHINIDNDWPYNVYGGMQDNGSWRGPAYAWRYGGIRNSYFEELSFGDGFDVVPDPANNRYGYSMSQEGYVGRYDFVTGDSRMIRPIHPDGTPLRFNWNAAIAQNPFNDMSIYFGSQFVHVSKDHGENWEVISPDLTTNDPEKQKQGESGGLTFDATGAENFTTIVSIAPSPLEEDVIWVGTDDGNLQLTRNGGADWTNLSDRLPRFPDGSWIPQIHPSTYEAGEAFVIVNNYRRNDWTPFLYHTTDFGTTWENMVSSDDVSGYCLSFVQDAKEPNLMFLGTEFGLYVSIDAGGTWTKWTNGYPTVSTMDMKIHPREDDLVIGTFGRSAFVLDDIRPLRALAAQGAELLKQELALYQPPTAVLAKYRQPSGARFVADGAFKGENRSSGARITYSAMPQPEDSTTEAPGYPDYVAGKDTASIAMYDQSGTHLRTLYQVPDSGLNRVRWNFSVKGPARPSMRESSGRNEYASGEVLPGTYKVKVFYGSSVDSTTLEVVMDPRLEVDMEALAAYQPLQERRNAMSAQLAEAANQIRKAKGMAANLGKLIPVADTSTQANALRDSLTSVNKQLQELQEKMFGKDDVKGYVDQSHTMISQFYRLGGYLSPENIPPSGTAEILLSEIEQTISGYISEVNSFFSGPWKDLETQMTEVKLEILTGFSEIE